MDLKLYETDLIGKWIVVEGRVVADETARRIDSLVAHRLSRLAATPDGWSTLFRDTEDGRLWERTYPQGQMHGGGPPRLSCISQEEAKTKYDLQ